MKNKKILLLVVLLCMPTVALAYNDYFKNIIGVLIIEGVLTIPMCKLFLKPLSEKMSPGNSQKTYRLLNLIRVVAILLFQEEYVFFDLMLLIIGRSIVKSITIKTSPTTFTSKTNTTNESDLGIELRCTKCNGILKVTDKFCGSCGEPFDGSNVSVIANENAIKQDRTILHFSDFDSMYNLSDSKLLEVFIQKELKKYDMNNKLIPKALSKRKNILNIIFSILLFVYVSLIFFHFPMFTYVIGLIILIVFKILSSRYNLIKYLKKQAKSRPQEKISNIIMSCKESCIKDNTRLIFFIEFVVSIVLALTLFIKPRIFYEKVDGGYAVRFYAFGVTNFKSATIPSTYKQESIISLRGNTFSNMPYLEEVNLPDTIIEIRGQAFKNDRSLVNVKLPSNLNYLGGGAFYNCTSLVSIEIPDSVTFMGGEAFYNAKSLKTIKLSNNLTEIRGDTFSSCSSLESITIPDSVTRIGGHAFYYNTSLSSVNISENSMLSEIGSSAFRGCLSLYSITIPQNTYVNYRAFKESPTVISRY